MHEGERRGRGKGVAARVGAAEIAAMGKGSAQEGRPSGTASQPPPSHRNIPSECSGVSHGLFYDFAPSSMRTLVFRSAYSASRNARASAAFAASIKPHRGLISKTLMLQVRCAHPAPSHRNAPSGHSGVPVGLFYAKSTQYSLLQNARPSGSLRSPYGYRRVEDPFPSVPCGCRNVREGDAAENGGEERRKVVEIMTCL